MAWSGGSFTRTDGTRTGSTVWAQAKAAAVKIISADHDTHDQDLATGINQCINKDGSNTVTGNLDLGSKKLTSLAAGSGAGDSVRYEQTALLAVQNVFTKRQEWAKGGDIASASPLVIDTDGNMFDVTGTTGFSAMTVAAGTWFILQFDGALTMTHGAGTLDLPWGANITTATGGMALCVATAANVVRVVSYITATTAQQHTLLGLVIGTDVQADLAVPSQAEAEAGTATTERVWTAQRVGQAIAALETAVSQANQAAIEAETNENTYIPPDLLKHNPGVAKGWVVFQVDGTVDANLNVSSVDDDGTGDFGVNWGTDFSGNDYVCVGTAEEATDFRCVHVSTKTGATAEIEVKNAANSLSDPDKTHVIAYGDQS